MIKIAVFDLDGTLVNSLTDLALSVNKGLKAAGLPEHPLSAYNRFVGNGRAKLIERAIGAERLTDALFDAVISVFDREYRLHCNDNTAAYDGCAGMLEALTKNGIATAVTAFSRRGGRSRSTNASPTRRRCTRCSACITFRLTAASTSATATSTC